jgi:ubiquinone biosynthesis protein UbiJ
MNTHDLKRQQDLIASLLKSKEKARIALLYLTVNDRSYEDISNVNLAVEHLDIALSHLGVGTEGETDAQENHST